MGLISLCMAIGVGWLALQAQAPQPERKPTFRSATALVEVDIIARDQDGRFVPGLAAEDFEVLEDGRPQQIEHFYLVTRRGTGAVQPAWAAAASMRAPDRTERRVFVFFFDSDHPRAIRR